MVSAEASGGKSSDKRHKVQEVAKHKSSFREKELSRRAKHHKKRIEEKHGKVKKHEMEVAKAKKQAKDDKAVDDEQRQSYQVLCKEKEHRIAKKEESVADESAEDDFFAEFSNHVKPDQRETNSINWEDTSASEVGVGNDPVPSTRLASRRKV